MNDIRKARKAAGMTQQELAERIGVNRATLSKYESGQIVPNLVQFKKIADALGVSVTDLWKLPVNPDNDIENIIADLEAHKDDPRDIDLLAAYRKLNIDGQRIAVERVEELTQIPKYQRTYIENAPEFNTGAQEGEKQGDLSTKQEKPPQGEFKPNGGNA